MKLRVTMTVNVDEDVVAELARTAANQTEADRQLELRVADQIFDAGLPFDVRRCVAEVRR